MSDVVAEQIRRRRDALGLTRHDLAKRCKDLGVPEVTYASLTNIETGRKENGQRRRLVTVEELATIARALGIPPVLLLFPVGRTQEMELLPGQAVPPGAALAWFTGEQRYPSALTPKGEVDEQTGLPEWYEDPEHGWEEGAAPLLLVRKFWDRVESWRSELKGRLPADEREQRKAAAVDELEVLQREFRLHGLTPPAVPDDLTPGED
ncbi:helix-turn-helix transcriptional regulator [Streptomyces althioticus]|uniref:helix-turn-helix transcriptional regulator n=1 Tax=Streptomyces althioticus TaxID=83380 RepID=UPI0033C54105